MVVCKVVSALQTRFNVHSMLIHESGLNPLPIHSMWMASAWTCCNFI